MMLVSFLSALGHRPGEAAPQGLLDGRHSASNIEWLGDVIGRPGLHRFGNRLVVSLSGDYDDDRAGASVNDEPAKTEPRHAREPDVYQCQMEKP